MGHDPMRNSRFLSVGAGDNRGGLQHVRFRRSSAVVKQGEFRLEPAESRRIVPEWASIQTYGRLRGSRRG
jgi:hypothetical protein